MTKRYLGNIITQNPTAPAGDLANSAAKGVWSLEEQLAYQKAGLWPVAGNFPPDVEDVFSTYLYTGTGSTLEINNGIDLDGEGGLVWAKRRTGNGSHWLVDTERGLDKSLKTNTTDANNTGSQQILSFDTDGFTLGNRDEGQNYNGLPYTSWTFRKAPKFFTCLTYSGTGPGSGANEQQVSHDLGAKPGIVIIKRTDSTGDWWVFTDVIDGSNDYGYLNQAAAFDNSANNVATDSVFNVGGVLNTSGATYVAYLFASNNGDGGFGADSDLDIIKCGIYTGTGSSSNPPVIDLGFEPQWLMIKCATRAGQNWEMFDNMRGVPTGGTTAELFPNTSSAERAAFNIINFTSTGFEASGVIDETNENGQTYIYMAIRRGTKVPESGTEVFDIDTRTGSLPSYVSTFPVDMAIRKLTNVATNWNIGTRLTGTEELEPNTTVAAGSDNDFAWDYMEGYGDDGNAADSNLYSWMWKRAPGYFDVAAEPIASAQMSGPASSSYNPAHNLGVTPEMIWVKDRDNTDDWYVYHSALGTSKKLILNSTAAESSSSWAVASDNFNFYAFGNATGNAICYLFASLPGISKVGSYTGNGSSQTIDCGFTSGAKFVIVKPTDGGNWFVFDTDRGITSSSSEMLRLNLTAAELSVSNTISPDSSGFIVEASSFNNSGDTYIFYAIA